MLNYKTRRGEVCGKIEAQAEEEAAAKIMSLEIRDLHTNQE